MILLDANYILRFLLKDNLEMYNIAEECILNNECYINNEVMAEVVFVLLKVYKVSKKDIEKATVGILNYENIQMLSKQSMIDTLEIFGSKNLDFVDCILCEESKRHTIKTFDKKLLKCINNKKDFTSA